MRSFYILERVYLTSNHSYIRCIVSKNGKYDRYLRLPGYRLGFEVKRGSLLIVKRFL